MDTYVYRYSHNEGYVICRLDGDSKSVIMNE